MVPTRPIAAFVMVQPQLLFELLIILLDLSAAFDGTHQSSQTAAWGRVAEKKLGGLGLAVRSFDETPPAIAWHRGAICDNFSVSAPLSISLSPCGRRGGLQRERSF